MFLTMQPMPGAADWGAGARPRTLSTHNACAGPEHPPAVKAMAAPTVDESPQAGCQLQAPKNLGTPRPGPHVPELGSSVPYGP